jgi:hypothetical protein
MPSLTFQFANAVAAVGNGSVDVESNAVTNDASGNVFVTGSLQGTADFDPGPTILNLTSAGNRDVFVAKYTKAGALAWAKDLRGGSGGSVAQGAAVAVDGSGNVLISGTFTGTVNFDPAAGNTSFTAAGRNDIFVAKYDPSGNLVWARDVAGTSGAFDQAYALAVDGAGNVAAAGSFQNTATFGTTALTAGGNFDSFVTKLNSSGQFLWTAVTTGSGSSVAQSAGVTFDGSGDVLSTGFFGGSVTFGIGASAQKPTPGDSRTIFIQKFDATGNLLWVDGLGGTDIDQANSIAADATGNLYVTGLFASTLNFNPAGNATLTAGGFEDAFLLKLNSAGQFGWVKDLATINFNAAQGTGVALDATGHVFVAGYFSGTLTLDPVASGATLTTAGDFDVFVGEYDTSGNFVAGQSAGGSNFDADFGIGVNSAGQVAIAGRYTGPAAFGPITLPSQPNKSIFIAQLASAGAIVGPPAPGTPALEAQSDSGLSNSDGITNATTLVLDVSGISSSNNFVELLRDGVVVGSRLGAGAITDPGPVPAGTHVYTARQTDALSHVSPLSSGDTVTVVTKTPSTPAALVLNPADDSGVKLDGITNVKQPRLVGTADPLTLVQLVDSSGNVNSSTMTASDGTYSLTPSAPLADGSHPYRVREEDIAGNLSALSPALPITIDTTPPAAPPAPSLLPSDAIGGAGATSSLKQPHLIGAAEPGSAVQLVNAAGAVIGSGSAQISGSYSIQIASPLADGTYLIRARATDAAGNAGAAGAAFSLTIQSTVIAPATPSAPILLAADDSGVKGDNITNVNRPHFTGTGPTGTTVQIVNAAGIIIGSAPVAGDGSYSVTPSAPLADGSYTLQARAIDSSNNLSSRSAALTLVIDTTAPVTPSAPVLFAGDDSGVKGDGVTNVRQPRFAGTTEPGATVQLLDRFGFVNSATTAAADGSYTVRPAGPLPDGANPFHVQTVDAAGNVSAPSAIVSVVIDTTPPLAPPAPSLLPTDDSGSVGDGITSVKQPHLIGTAEGSSFVQLLNAAGTVLGSGTAQTSGLYSIQIASPLADDTYLIRAQATDAAGNTGTPGAAFSLTILSSVTLPATPSAPVLLASDDSGVQGDDITNVNQPHLTGTGPMGTTVQIVGATGTVIGSAPVGADGSYSITPSAPLLDGSYTLEARAVDASNNLSVPSAPLTLVIDTTPPIAPTAPTLLAADNSGAKDHNITSVKQPRVIGSSEPGVFVQLLDSNGSVIETTIAGSDGSYTVAPSTALGDGTYLLTARAIDVAGNVGPASGPLSLTILTSTPAAPTGPILLATDDSGVKGDRITNVNQPHLTGTATAGLTVQVVDAFGTVLGATIAASDGSYSVQPSSSLADGTYSLQTRQVDAAGNVGPNGPVLSLTILATPPAAPAAPTLVPTDDTGPSGDGTTAVRRPHVTGSTLPGGSVDLLDPNGIVLASTSASLINGAYTLQPATNLGEGALPLRVRVRDAAGNLSPAGAAFNLTVVDATPGDYEGDGKTDLSIFRPSTEQWIGQYSSGSGGFVTSFGGPNLMDIPVPGDYDGTGHVETAVFRPSTSQWFIMGPAGARVVSFGAPNLFDIPVPGDYDNVGYAEPAVFRPSTGQWFVLGPNGGRLFGTFGASNLHDIPVPGDYDGTGHTEMAVFRPSTAQWFVMSPSGGRLLASFGATNLFDIPTVAPIASLKRLGTMSGVTIASLTASSPPRTAAETVVLAAAPASSSRSPSAAAPAVATQESAARTRERPRQEAVLGHALDSLLAERHEGLLG